VAAYVFAGHELAYLRKPLTIVPHEDMPLAAKRGAPFEADFADCSSTPVSWRVEGPAELRDSLGQLSQTEGSTTYYSAPSQVATPFDVYLTALRDKDIRRVKIHLLPLPDYTSEDTTQGTDSHHQTADFVVYVINERYSWEYEGYELQGPEKGVAFAQRMAADGLLSGFDEQICIGAASREHVDLEEEERRAVRRARLFADWVRNALPRRYDRVHALKIGRYDDPRPSTREQTKKERQVVIVGASHPGKTVDLMSALRDAFSKLRGRQPILGMYLDHYPAEQWVLDPPPPR
jgi:hypothetical protein